MQVIVLNGTIVGAAKLGQQFSDTKYFWGCPSAVDYNGGRWGGGSKGASNQDYLKEVGANLSSSNFSQHRPRAHCGDSHHHN